jgi:nucleotide-binding universal stress UspA family protein
MLVVGKRGGGGFAGLKFGSTADQVVRYAKVPVLVVPNRHD